MVKILENEYQTHLLENILTAQVLVLAQQLKAEKKARGVSSTSDFINEAAIEIKKQQGRVLQAVRA